MRTDNRLNVLELKKVQGEDAAEDARWEQAKEVCSQLDAGRTQREIAADWINLRTRKPYSHQHVSCCQRIWKRFGKVPCQDRPRWSDALATVMRGSDETVDTGKEWGDRMEARPPTSVESANRLARNLTTKAPPEVREAFTQGLVKGMSDAERVQVAKDIIDTVGPKAGTQIESAAVEATDKRQAKAEPPRPRAIGRPLSAHFWRIVHQVGTLWRDAVRQIREELHTLTPEEQARVAEAYQNLRDELDRGLAILEGEPSDDGDVIEGTARDAAQKRLARAAS
jgi:hypothetical protein